ncbi:JAB N-terminal domain-containing protein [Amorphoplanes digitatis]|uniref:Proteasome lid subunit RPN8/RPN11 n=1 Tax=Actinoplanes digitatis TaxID=1868 RepID=A0A7W7MSX9_9ACTN|nr:JAB N-terminal domain-containing protein [Actinoplanes digitatis]MBB4765771.1 proteasome lid subunit RPN8/RPN11 [Actinoplanes digitatis]BFE75678.1 hypothetical protein GCM10020092_089790 [Actinoplanes digitatis]GID93437.1 hypothetical protein Adi01nite_28490 [Actinoplanes digitatis]
MSLGIDLYRSDDYVRAGRIDLLALLMPLFERVLGESLRDTLFTLKFHPISDLRELYGEPSLLNLRSSHGYVTVQITRGGRVIYQHPHAVREIIGRPLQRILSEQVPDERQWGFGVSGPGLEAITLERPAPRQVGAVDVAVRQAGPRVLHMEEMPDPEPPLADVAELGVAEPATSDDVMTVVVARPVQELLLKDMPLSDEVEEGGFLLGRVLRDRARGGHLVHVTAAQPAERTGASLLNFTFTGESFLRINQTIGEASGAYRLVGWYHTHLFPATDGVGLSSIDVDLHTTTFRRPWHLAALLNIDDTGERLLRTYRWDGEEMRLARHRIGAPWKP